MCCVDRLNQQPKAAVLLFARIGKTVPSEQHMTKINLGEVVTIIANIGVIAGLVFLAYEIRQNTAQMRAEAAYAIHQDAQRLP